MQQVLLPSCICGCLQYDPHLILEIPILRCSACGVLRQNVNMTEKELGAWYRDHYFKGQYQHSYQHDYEVAKLRLNRYQITAGAKLLDVGSGNGAFVAAARERGIVAWGQDVAEDSLSEHVYVGQLEDVAFPTDEFDVVVVHDVLEHLVRPDVALREIKRILKRPGKLILDFPRFHHERGKHHWKAIEHLWMFSEDQLLGLLKQCGFVVTNSYLPIPSKIVFEAEPRAEVRPSIITPAGIGDSWWVLTKLPGFLAEHKLGMPDVWVMDQGGPKRTQPFLRTIPWISAPGYLKTPERSKIYHEAYVQNARTVFPNQFNCDYFIAYNGVMRAGRSLEEVDPQYGCQWRSKMHISKEAQEFRTRLTETYGKYVITFYAEAGMYRAWLAQFPPEQIAQALKLIEKELGAHIIFIGAKWDMGQVGAEIVQMDPNWISLIGGTSYDQMLGAILGAEAVVGYPAGNTMLGTHFNVPTVLLWNEYFDQRFWKNACPPDSPYQALDTFKLQPEDVLRAIQEVVYVRPS